jgi:hypothetical protein
VSNVTPQARAWFVAVYCACGTAAAHHSFGTFDMNSKIEIVGTVEGIDFVNPHSWLRIRALAEDRTAVTYRCEMRGATVLRRSGWTSEMFVPGEPITVHGAPDRVDPLVCYLNTVVLANGRTFDRYSQRSTDGGPEPDVTPTGAAMPRMPSGVPNIAGDWAVEQQVMSDPRGRLGTLVPLSASSRFAGGAVPRDAIVLPGSEGFGVLATTAMLYRLAVGAVSPYGLPWIDRPVRLTERGAAAAVLPEQHPQMQCMTTSIIFNWYMETLVNRITQDEALLTIEYGHGLIRTIHLNAEHSANLVPSRAGHSIGRWDGDTLVVDTVGFLPGMLTLEVAHGEGLHVVERFTLNSDGSVLTRDYTATDRDHFVGAYRGTDQTPRSQVPFVVDVCDAALNPVRQ